MEIVAYIFIAFIGIYALFYVNVVQGRMKIDFVQLEQDTATDLFISLVVPFRNEEDALPHLIDCLKAQNYPKHLYEVLLIDDHSTDSSSAIVKESLENTTNFYSIKVEERFGKKAALEVGYKLAKGTYILSTDADCIVNKNWLRAHAAFAAKTNADFVLGGVNMVRERGMLKQFQLIEHMALQASTIGTMGLGQPIMSNGANLMFRKASLSQFNDPLNRKYSSGDDVFLLQKFKKDKQLEIHFNSYEDSIVETGSLKSFSGFFHQHMRWLSKSRAYRDVFTMLATLIIGAANLSLLGSFALVFFNVYFVKYFLFILLLKTMIDLILLTSISKIFRYRPLFMGILIFELFYATFSLLTFFGAIFIKPKWKGRTIQS